ncbi:MAG: hypothetical protein K0S53_1232 [Bacteroidetes bacterium]|jgi:hypothetical protein|nr:hypothetical protein [Bacteroidota bacterium]MDF2452302.1 hypothetical protein [Bacteroidota bacterium]
MELKIYFKIIAHYQLAVYSILSLVLPNFICAQSIARELINDSNQIADHQPSTPERHSGKFIKTHQVNKAGKKLKTYDYFFLDEKTGKQYFIKFNEKTISINDIEKHITYNGSTTHMSKPLQIKSILKEGLWDATDPKQQSRIGEYIHVYEIITE